MTGVDSNESHELKNKILKLAETPSKRNKIKQWDKLISENHSVISSSEFSNFILNLLIDNQQDYKKQTIAHLDKIFLWSADYRVFDNYHHLDNFELFLTKLENEKPGPILYPLWRTIYYVCIIYTKVQAFAFRKVPFLKPLFQTIQKCLNIVAYGLLFLGDKATSVGARGLIVVLFFIMVVRDFNSGSHHRDEAIKYYKGSFSQTKNDNKAFQEMSIAANKGDVDAYKWLHDFYRDGIGTAKDIKKATYWLKRAADTGETSYRYLFAKENFDRGNYLVTLNYATSLAKAGDSSSQNLLGLTYERDSPPDYKKSLYWFNQAALNGNLVANYNLAVSYYNGTGVDINYPIAYKYALFSARGGYDYAQKLLGDMYYYGYGVNRNIDESLLWYEKAAKQGLLKAKLMSGIIYSELTEPDFQKALYWLNIAKNEGSNQARIKYDEIQEALLRRSKLNQNC